MDKMPHLHVPFVNSTIMDDGATRSEAERCLFTANKLLSGRDLHGARSFAIRVREVDPTYDAAELLMTVIDTVVAGDALINDRHRDWYGILQVTRYTSNIDQIAEKYRRLALLLDPHRNPFALTSHAFSLVHDAWSVLSDSVKKAMYDNDIRLSESQTPPPQQPQPPQPKPQQKKNRRSKNVLTETGRNTRTESGTQSNELARAEVEEASFWTSCPYCYVMYEYPKVYEECTLRCQNCRRGFHAVVIRSPPLNGLDESFCSWGFLPLVFSGDSKDINGVHSNWNPFSPFFPCSLKGNTKKKKDWVYYDDEVATAFINISDPSDDDSDGDWRGGKMRAGKRARSSKKNISDVKKEPVRRRRRSIRGGGAGNENVGGGTGNKNAGGGAGNENVGGGTGNKNAGGGGTGNENVGGAAAGNENAGGGGAGSVSVGGGSGCVAVGGGAGSVAVGGSAGSVSVGGGGSGSVSVGGGRSGCMSVGGGGAGSVAVGGGGSGSVALAVDGVVPDGINANAGISMRAQPGNRDAAGGPRRMGAESLGKLDLNVELSNDVEERQEPSRAGMREGHPTGHADDNIDGIGFFEGLDEFLSSLPILNVVGDDKVKDH